MQWRWDIYYVNKCNNKDRFQFRCKYCNDTISYILSVYIRLTFCFSKRIKFTNIKKDWNDQHNSLNGGLGWSLITTANHFSFSSILHLLDQKYSKTVILWNITRTVIYIFSFITLVFSVTWSFRNHSNMLICCSENISYY